MRLPVTLLQNRFRLTRRLYTDPHSHTWLGVDTLEDQPTEQACIIRLWPFSADISDEAARVLWSREERRMRRLAGTAGVDESLMTLVLSGREEPAGEDTWYLVMVLKSTSTGYTPLAVEVDRPSIWLRPADLKIATHRASMWGGLRRVAIGIQLLHRQRILHRNVSLETIFWDATLENGPRSMRLGGFETSLRFGMEEAAMGPTNGSLSQYAATFPMDWFRLGVVLASIFCGAKVDLSATIQTQIATCECAIGKQGNTRLTPRERLLILRLLSYGTGGRVVAGESVVSEFKCVEETLQKDASKLDRTRPLALVFNPNNIQLLRACQLKGFAPNTDVSLALSERDLLQQEELRDFLRAALAGSRLFRVQDSEDGQQRCILVGGRGMCFLIGSFVHQGTSTNNIWEKAFLIAPSDLRDGAQRVEDLKDVIIEPIPREGAERYRFDQTWKPVVPPLPADRRVSHETHGARIHHFLRATNLLDLLLTSARIFPFERLGEPDIDPCGRERITIKEGTRVAPLPPWTNVKDGLSGDLTNETESGKQNCDLVLLTSNDELHVKGVKDCDWWKIEDPGTRNPARITLVRNRNSNQSPVPKTGFIRSFGLYGLFTLINRRKRAIDNMKDNTLLLRVMELADSGAIQRTEAQMTISNDSQDSDLYLRYPSRRCFFEDVDRVRPLYVLQGPPGTGKSTFVANHMRRILDKSREPYAQILVTAQAHAGVDVLREKVAEAFDDLAERESPLSIRLGERSFDKDSIRNVSARCLQESLNDLNASESPLDTLQIAWYNALETALKEFNEPSLSIDDSVDNDDSNRITGSLLRGTMQLLRRCAGISYCTASAKDLAELARENDFDNTYDLVIVEEAGKIHAFDLVLPMSAGYSWLLIGDHKQLPAFQIDNFERGLRSMDSAVAALRTLPASNYIDTGWLGTWEEWSEDKRERHTKFSINLLRYFKWLHESIAGTDGSNATERDEALGTGAGRLSDQFRMPEPICKLISDAFYSTPSSQGRYRGLTTGRFERVPYSITLNLDSGTLDWSRYPIIWIDTPWCQRDPRFGEAERTRVNQREIRIVQTLIDRLQATSMDAKELTVAVLTPYRRQLGRLLEVVGKNPAPPAGCKFKASINARDGGEKWVHTVDSFQGNEADIVITSLVRNNPGTGDIERALGFLADPERMNVLLSRAMKQLIIVGSWEFFNEQLRMRRVGPDTPNHELWFLGSVIRQLEAYFNEDVALLLQSASVTAIHSV